MTDAYVTTRVRHWLARERVIEAFFARLRRWRWAS